MARPDGVRDEAAPLARRFARDVRTTTLGNLFPPAAAIITAPILAQSLGVDARGVVASVAAPYVLMTTAGTLGLPEAVSYAVARNPRVVRSALRHGAAVVVVVGLLETVAVLLASRWLSGGLDDSRRLIALAALGIVPALLLGVVRGAAAGMHEWRLVAQERAITSGVRLVATAVLAMTGTLTPLSATIVLVAAPVLGAAPYVRLGRSIVPVDESEPVVRRSLVRYGSRVWIGSVAGIILMRLDQAVLAPLAGTVETGLYVVAVTVAEVPLILSGAVRDVTFTRETAGATGRVASIARLTFLATAVVGVCLAAVAPLLVPLLFGRDFSGAVGPCLVLVAAVVLGVPGSIGGAALSGQGRPGLRSVAVVLGCVANVVVLVWLAGSLGAMGAAWAMLAGTLVASNAALLMLWCVRREPVWTYYVPRLSDLREVRALLPRVLSGRAASAIRDAATRSNR